MQPDFSTLTPATGTSTPQTPPAPTSTSGSLQPDLTTLKPVSAVPTSNPLAGAEKNIGGFGKWAAKSFQEMEQPFISVAATPVQLLAKLTGQPDPFAQGVPSGVPGMGQKSLAANLTPSGMFQKLGQAASIGLLTIAPEATGPLKLGLLGGAQGLANSIGAGNTDKGQLESDTIKGALFGGTLGLLGNAARVIANTEKASAGIDPAMETELGRTRPTTVSKYINTAVESANDYHAPSVDTLLGQDIQKGANILISKVLPQAGKALDEAHAASAGVPIQLTNEGGTDAVGAQAIPLLRDDINNVMQQMTGHQFSSYAEGESGGLDINPRGEPMATTEGVNPSEGSVTPLPGRAVQLTASEQKALESVDEQLRILAQNPTVQTASDVLKNLDAKIDWNRPQFGSGSSPVDGLVKYARGAINRTIAPGAPALAEANNAWGTLQDVKNAVADAAGKDLDHINLLARRVLYRGEEGGAQSVLDTLFNTVKSYLPAGEESYTTKAIIARYARDTFGGVRGESGLNQSMSPGDIGATVAGYTSRIVGAALKEGKRVLTPDPAEYAMSIAKGEPYSFVPAVHKIDKFVDSPSGNRIIQGFKNGLKAMGVSSKNVETAAVQTLKMMLLTNFTQPSAQPLPAGVTPVQQSSNGRQSLAPSSSGKTLSLAQPAITAINQVSPATSGQQFSSKSRQLGDFGMNMRNAGGFTLS